MKKHNTRNTTAVPSAPDAVKAQGPSNTDQNNQPLKDAVFIGSAYDDWTDLPPEAQHDAGYLLHLLQCGHTISSAKPMTTVGPGTEELIVNTKDGWHRVFFVAKFQEAVYVLHAFTKKTDKTPKKDIDKGKARYGQMIRERPS